MYDNIIKEDLKFILKNVNLRKFNNSNVLILGGNSFLATYIQASLDYANNNNFKCNITSVSLNNPKSLFKEIYKNSNRIKFIKADINDLKNIKIILKKKFNYIFHCATYGQPKKWDENQFSTINLSTKILKILLDYSLKNKTKILYFSSADVYSANDNKKKLIDENDKLGLPEFSNRIIYSASKIIGEQLCKIYKNKGVRAYVVRPGHTYGPGQDVNDQRIISQLIRRGIFEKNIYLMDNGRSVKTWGYIADITIMFLNIITEGKSLIYNTTGNNFVSIYQLAKIISKYFNNKKIVIKNNKILNSYIGSGHDKIKLSSKKYFNEFKKFKTTNFKTGVKRLIKWNINNSKIISSLN
jgi:dTDP-glucose 4,6-dehydratase/UDP-glucuronate decarboxylase